MKRLGFLTIGLIGACCFVVASCHDDGTPPVVPVVDNGCQVLASDGTAVVVGSNLPGDPALPEAASGYRTGLKAVYAKRYMVTTSNAFASAAGCKVLMRGGTAADAAVAVQAVLGLTVPEATGLGSGGFMLYYDAASKSVQTYDGRESHQPRPRPTTCATSTTRPTSHRRSRAPVRAAARSARSACRA